MKVRDPKVLCATCPIYLPRPSGDYKGHCCNAICLHLVKDPDIEFCNHHPDWKLIDAPTS